MIGDVLSPEMERLATEVVDAAFRVHTALGPGLLESVYETCLVYELRKKGIKALRQVPVSVVYDGVLMDDLEFRIDVLVEDCIVVENKAVEKVIPLFRAQLLSYMKQARKRLGFLINFNVVLIKDGITRMMV